MWVFVYKNIKEVFFKCLFDCFEGVVFGNLLDEVVNFGLMVSVW